MEISKVRISVSQAAKILGVYPDTVRYMLRKEMSLAPEKKTFNIGQARPAKAQNSKRVKYRYDVYLPKVLAYIGIESVEELPEELRKMLN
ncbi:MAG: hypothetical protein Q4B26_03830 [Eubacteriales bacterium]|nr:hypothetical protein [Eubacteriales bacterium]